MKPEYKPPIQTLLDKTQVYSIDATDKKTILVYTDPLRKLKPKLYLRSEFAQQGGIVGLYHFGAKFNGPFSKF